MARTDPIRDVWNRVRGIGRRVEEEIYDFTEEDPERDEEPRGRNTLIALINSFFTMWRASQATAAERTLGSLAGASLVWWIVIDRGLGFKRAWVRIPATAFLLIWFVPGFIAGTWTVAANLGVENMRRWRSWPLTLVFSAAGLIAFRAVFSELARREIRPLPDRSDD
jgi:hypothetical protein